MTTPQAKNIIADLMQWQMYSQGILDDQPKPFEYKLTLKQLLQANEKVVKWNQRQREKNQPGGFSQQMTFADRALAGIYCCLNFPSAEFPHITVNMIGCATVQMKES